jgi:hypothetical protein
MQSTDRSGPARWQAPLEADPADAQEQSRDVLDDNGDPEAPADTPRAGIELDLSRGSEADLAEQLLEVPYDDDGER